MPLPEPFRGAVWDVDFAEFGMHPAVVLSVNLMNTRLGHVAVVPVTGTAGPEQTHVPLDKDAGLSRYEQSATSDVRGSLAAPSRSPEPRDDRSGDRYRADGRYPSAGDASREQS